MSALEFSNDYQIRLLSCAFHVHEVYETLKRVMRPGDWGLQAARFVWCCLTEWHEKFKTWPTPEMLADYVLKRCLSGEPVGGEDRVYISEGLHESLAHVTCRVLNTAPADAKADAPYMLESVHRFLVHVRCAQAAAAADPLDTRAMVGAQAQAVAEVDAAFKRGKDRLHQREGAYVDLPHERQDGDRAPVGVPILDQRLGGGLERGNAGIVIAGTGVGKTNAGLHIATAAGYAEHGALVLSLELNQRTMQRRATAMAANVPAGQLFLHSDKVDVKYKDAIAAVRHPGYPFRESLRVAEITDHNPKIAEIEEQIAGWKKDLLAEGKPPEYPLVVVVDWLECLDVREWLGRDSGSANSAAALESAMRALRMVAVRQDVVLWTAMQANREAVGREVFGMERTAHSYGANTVADLTLTLARKASATEQECGADWLTEESANPNTDNGVFMNLKIAKCRGANLTDKVVELYRAPSLRFWQSADSSDLASAAIKDRNWAKLVEIDKAIRAGSLNRR